LGKLSYYFSIIFHWLISCKNHPHLWVIMIQFPMIMKWLTVYQQDDVVLFVNIMIHVVDLWINLIFLISWNFCLLWLIMIWFSMWGWNDMPFCNKVSQIFMAIHDFLWHHRFLCVLNLWPQYLSWHVIIHCVLWGF
jgi:hypothetical protein